MPTDVALWFRLRINDEMLGAVEARRVERLDLSDQAAIQDVVSTYEVKRDGVLVGTVRHCYGDRAWKLAALALTLIAEHDAGQRGRTELAAMVELDRFLDDWAIPQPEAKGARR